MEPLTRLAALSLIDTDSSPIKLALRLTYMRLPFSLTKPPGEVRDLVFEFDCIGQKAASEEESRRIIQRALESRYVDSVA